MQLPRSASLLLNAGHALDHMFLLIFATAVASIAHEFGFDRWEDLMPYGAGAFLMFGLGSMPAGRWGDLWGRRSMMLVFFFGLGVSAMLAACATGPWTLAVALTVLGAFASIYHPVGIPMLLQHAQRPGSTIGFNGLAGNLGIALAALLTGLLVKYFGWRVAFAVPGVLAIVCGLAFAASAPGETEAPAKRTAKASQLPADVMVRVFLIMTLTAVTSSLMFNFTTNGNGQLLRERFEGIVEDPAALGALLSLVYAIASLSQLAVGRLIDRIPLRRLFLSIVVAQIPLFALASVASGWSMFVLQTAFMASIFGAIPFTDALVVRYVDDRLRSRVTGVRLAVSLGISSTAVWALGPAVKVAGFQVLLVGLAGIAVLTAIIVSMLPGESQMSVAGTPQPASTSRD